MKWTFFFLLSASLLAFSLDGTSQLVKKDVQINSRAKGFYIYTPPGYDPAQKYPLMVSLHGLGEIGPTSTKPLTSILNNAPMRYINSGFQPNMIVIAPQYISWIQSYDIHNTLNYAIANYSVDTTRMYLIGLSMGGGAAWDFLSVPAYTKRIAAFAVAAGASTPSAAKAKAIRNDGLPVWAFHNSGDPTVVVSQTNGWVSQINASPTPKIPAKKTIFTSNSHDSWSKSFDPNYREDGKNVYEWLLQYTQRGVVPVNRPPVVTAIKDTSFFFAQGSVQLTSSASDLDNDPLTYQWSKLNGPAEFNLSNPAVAGPVLSNLVVGIYTFRVIVTDSKGASASDDVVVTVKADPVQVKQVKEIITLYTDNTYSKSVVQ